MNVAKMRDWKNDYSDRALICRLLALTWRFRAGFIGVISLRMIMLLMNLGNLGLTGLGIDYIRYQLQPGAGPPRWLFGIGPPSSWTPMVVLSAIAAAMLTIALMRALLKYAFRVSVALLVQGSIIVGIRSQVYDKLQRLSFRFFDANASSTIINRVTVDSKDIGFFIKSVLLESIVTAISLTVCIAYLLAIHVKLTLACLATTPLLFLFARMFSRTMRPLHSRNRELVDALVLRIAESFRGIQIIKGFARERESLESFQRSNRDVHEHKQKLFRSMSLFAPTVGLVNQFNIVILLIYGGHLLMTGELRLGSGMVVFAGLLQSFSAQIANGVQIANTTQRSLTGSRRVFELLDAPVDIVSPPDSVRMPRARGKVAFKNVSFGYRERNLILKDISFEVSPGESVAILGVTGGGKSTLLSLIPRFYDPVKGRILLDGVDLRNIELDDLRRNIGLVFQESFLFNNTIAANIAFGHPEASQEAVQRAAAIAGAHDFITKMPRGYQTFIGEGGRDLSGGQRQRIAIARAILPDPALLLLDDPTSSVDPHMEADMLQSIENAMRGRTTFITAHRISTLRRAHRIIVLEEGRIAEAGTHDELIRANGLYRRAAELQFAEA